MMPIKAIAVVGPTAGGKSALALELARRLGGEILSCDSMQVYRGMDIGTAKPTEEERESCPHHLIDIASPHEPFSAADWAERAMQVLRDVNGRGRLAVFCGGTGLYLDAVRTLRHGGETPPADPALRERLNREAETEEGREALWQQLLEIDPDAAAATHKNNTRRVVRALEVYRLTGKTKTELDRAASKSNPDLDLLVIGLCYEDRDLLRARINARVGYMLQAGLADEVRRLSASGVFDTNATAAAAIGYKELLPYLAGECSLDEAAERLATATAQYAKRQMTYFRRMQDVHWLTAHEGARTLSASELADRAMPLVFKFLTDQQTI